MNTRAKGLAGERRARTSWWARATRCWPATSAPGGGEVDLIVRKSGRICFVEVKSWDVLSRDDLGEAIGPAKRRRIVEVARHYLAAHPGGERPGFDVILLRGAEVLHLQDAFDGVA